MKQTQVRKLSITLREDLLQRMDDYADDNAMTRSGLIAVAVTQYLNAVEAMPSVNKLLNSMAAVVDSTLGGQLTPEDAEQQLQQIQNSYAALTGGNAGK